LDSVEGFLAQSRGLACDVCLAQSFDVGHSSIERVNKLAQRMYHETVICHRRT
jgi:hypothetical protein